MCSASLVDCSTSQKEATKIINMTGTCGVTALQNAGGSEGCGVSEGCGFKIPSVMQGFSALIRSVPIFMAAMGPLQRLGPHSHTLSTLKRHL